MLEFALYTALIISISGVFFQFFCFRKRGQLFTLTKKKQDGRQWFAIKEFVFNTVLQIKLFNAGKIRWGCHFFLVISFLYLVVVHALHDVTSPLLFSYYEPTVDPYQFLRNLAGVLVLAGCIAFFVRRLLKLRINLDSRMKAKGFFSITLILLVIGSGFLLEAAKIISEPVFMEMVDEYSSIDETTELEDLKLFWEKEYHVVFAETSPATRGRLENGRSLNEEYCLDCHSDIRSAFLSKWLAKRMFGAGRILNHYRVDAFLYTAHYMLCLLLLISLPFSRLFHLLLIPFASSRPKLTLSDFQENGAFIHSAALYACTHCGYCSEVCSVYPNFQITRNPDLLPHSKIESVKAMMQSDSAVDLWQLHSGNTECTMCHNCTQICPSGIDLQSLWTVLDQKLANMGHVDSNRFVGNMPLTEWAKKEAEVSRLRPANALTSNLSQRVDAFENCIQCTICTSICPVVDYDADQNDITPHQVMNLLRLGKRHLASGTRMVWTCLTCYSCQEHCPQQIRVTDILLELRNTGSRSADMRKQTPLNEVKI